MFRLVAERLILGAITLGLLLTAIFFATAILPGDLAEIVLGREATAEALANYRRQMGLDLPLFTQYQNWLSGLVQGDLGTSFSSGAPIREMALPRLLNTLYLAAYAAGLGIPLALVLGLFSAVFRDSLLDRALNMVTLTSISFPDFFVAYVLIYVFAIVFPVFPSVSVLHEGVGFWEYLNIAFLPAATLALLVLAHLMRMTRAAIVDVLSRSYIEMADLKGIKKARIVIKHALPNALSPIINVIAFNLAYLVLGVVVIEVVFAYPGLGELLVDSVSRRDIPMVQAACLFFACTYLMVNLLADILSIWSNPRLRYP